jgi:hypothetical protein
VESTAFDRIDLIKQWRQFPEDSIEEPAVVAQRMILGDPILERHVAEERTCPDVRAAHRVSFSEVGEIYSSRHPRAIPPDRVFQQPAKPLLSLA